MMKKAALLFVVSLVLTLGLAGMAEAAPGDPPVSETEAPAADSATDPSAPADPGVLPDSPFYLFKRLFESVRLLLTFSPQGDAILLAEFAELRLLEAQAMVAADKVHIAREMVQDYVVTLEQAEQKVAALIASNGDAGDAADAADAVKDAADKAADILERVLEQIPEEARPAVEQARESIDELSEAVEEEIEAVEEAAEAAGEAEEADVPGSDEADVDDEDADEAEDADEVDEADVEDDDEDETDSENEDEGR